MTHVKLQNCLEDELSIVPKPKQSLLPRQGVPVILDPFQRHQTCAKQLKDSQDLLPEYSLVFLILVCKDKTELG